MLSLTFHISLNLMHVMLKNKYIQIKGYLSLLVKACMGRLC